MIFDGVDVVRVILGSILSENTLLSFCTFKADAFMQVRLRLVREVLVSFLVLPIHLINLTLDCSMSIVFILTVISCKSYAIKISAVDLMLIVKHACPL